MGHQVTGLSDTDLVAALREDEAVVRDRRARQSALIAEAERRGVPTTLAERIRYTWIRMERCATRSTTTRPVSCTSVWGGMG